MHSIVRTGVVLALFLAGSVVAKAQFVPFSHTYGGTEAETGYGVVEAADSGYVCTGQTGSFSAGSSDMYLFKTDINGQLIWQTHVGGLGTEGGKSITKGYGGGFLAVGYTNSYGSGGYDYYLVRINDNGDTLWTRTYGGTDWDFAYSVCQTSDGNYLVAGESYSTETATGSDIWLLKVDDNGDTLSTFRWVQPGNQTATCIKEYAPGKAVVAGYGVFMPATDLDGVLLGWNHSSNTLDFSTVHAKTGDQKLNTCTVSVTGGFAAFGVDIDVVDSISQDLLCIFYQANGAFDHLTEVMGSGGNYDLEAFSVQNYSNTHYYLGCHSHQLGATATEAIFFKFNAGAEYVEVGRVLGGSNYHGVRSLIQSVDNGIVMAGIAEGFGPGPSGALLWKLDSAYQTVLTPTPVLANEVSELPVSFGVYPNPFFGQLTISVPESVSLSEIVIWDMNGRALYRTFVKGQTGQISIDLPSLAQGMYTAEFVLQTGKRHYRKLVCTPW